MTQEINTDIAIIGAGPAGLFTIFEAGMMGYKCAIVDSLDEVGGQPQALYPEKPIYDIPGHPSILASELIDNLVKQAEPFKPEYVLGAAATEMVKEGGTFKIKAGEKQINAKAICIAAGGGMFAPRKPPVNGIDEFEEKSIAYAVKNKEEYRGKKVVIAGGGDSAADWAVELAEIAEHVSIIHRRLEFRAVEETVNKMYQLEKEGRITIYTPCQLAGLNGENGELNRVTVRDLDGNATDVKADKLLCFFGIIPTLGPVADWGLEFNKKKIKVNPETMETNIEGITAIGDMADYPAKIGLILVAFAEAAQAAKTMQHVISPEKKFKVVYSSNSGVPA